MSPLSPGTQAMSPHKVYDFLPVLPFLSSEWLPVDETAPVKLALAMQFALANERAGKREFRAETLRSIGVTLAPCAFRFLPGEEQTDMSPHPRIRDTQSRDEPCLRPEARLPPGTQFHQ